MLAVSSESSLFDIARSRRGRFGRDLQIKLDETSDARARTNA
jgi:hypothetical protein